MIRAAQQFATANRLSSQASQRISEIIERTYQVRP